MYFSKTKVKQVHQFVIILTPHTVKYYIPSECKNSSNI